MSQELRKARWAVAAAFASLGSRVLVRLGATGNLLALPIVGFVEHRANRPLLSGFHFFFSAGGLVAAGIGIVVADHISAFPHLAAVSAGMMLLFWLASRDLLAERDDRADKSSMFVKPPRAFVPLALIALALRRQLGTSSP